MNPTVAELVARLKTSGAWTAGPYTAPVPLGCLRDSAPFEAADLLEMQEREIEQLRAAMRAAPPSEARTDAEIDGLIEALDTYCESLGRGAECGLPTWRDDAMAELRMIIRQWLSATSAASKEIAPCRATPHPQA